MSYRWQVGLILVAAVAALGAGPLGGPDELPIEATSLLGEPLRRPILGDEFRNRQEALLEEARRDQTTAPDDPDAAIWVGRRKAYLGRYREAIEIYSSAIETRPGNAALYRHRGHRYITVRKLSDAVADLERAVALVDGKVDEVEADGLPNALGIPTSTLHTNIWYHLGLAYYLQGDFEKSAAAYRTCRDLASNPDMSVAASYWLYLSLRRAGDQEAATEVLTPITADLEIIENHDYFHLLRAFAAHGTLDDLLDSQLLTVESATKAYGVGAWHLLEGDVVRARSIFGRIVAGEAWAAFGHIAAEAELSRSP